MDPRRPLLRLWPLLVIFLAACLPQPTPQVIFITATPPPPMPTALVVVVTATPLPATSVPATPTARVIVVTATQLPASPTALPSATSAPPTALPPTATPTATPTLTSTPLPTATPLPLVASGNPADWLPAAQDLPAEMVLNGTRNESNETLAGEQTNPAEMLANYQKWGRVTNAIQEYGHKDRCSAKSGVRYIYPEVVLMTSETGASQYYDYLSIAEQAKADGPIIAGASVGRRAYWYYANDTTTCNPPDNLRRVRLQWQRNNILGDVRVWGIAGTVSDADLLALATRLGRAMDARIIAALKPGAVVATAPTGPAAPSGPPGVYVTALAVDPPNPKRGQGVRFVATFSNTTGAARDFDWLVMIYQPDKKNAFGETAVTHVTVPAGVSQFGSASNWAVTGSGGCISLYAQPVLRDSDGSRQPFANAAGGVASPGFEVCP